MLDIPALRPDLAPDFIGEECVILRSETGIQRLDGDLFCSVIGRIDGRRTKQEIAATLAGLYPVEEVYYALAAFEKRGLIVEAECAATRHAALWFDAGVAAQIAHQRLAAFPVQVAVCGGIDAVPFLVALGNWGVRVQTNGCLQVVLTADPAGPACEPFHRTSLATGQPWMLVKAAGRMGWIGPLFRPGKTACWECLRWRLEENHYQASSPGSFFTGLFFEMAAAQLALWIARANAEIEEAVLTFDAVRMERQRHLISRRPQCGACGQPQPALPEPVLVLQSRPAVFTSDGGHRNVSPAESRSRLERHVSPLTGVIRGVSERRDAGSVPVFAAYYHGPLGSKLNRDARAGDFEGSGGKGRTPDQAWTSCVAEALERYSACYCGDEPLVRAAWHEIRNTAVHPCDLLLYSQAQYDGRKQGRNRTGPSRVPLPFHEEEKVEWCAAWSLTSSAVRYLPAGCAFLGYQFREGRRYGWGDTNGCAAGNTIEEAILQGFLELVERDASAIWWYNRLLRPAVDLDSFGVPELPALRKQLTAAGRTVHLLDITTDLAIPAFAATSWREDGGSVRVGFGAHLDPRIAASRAVTELNQVLPGEQPDERVTLAGQPHLAPGGGAARTARDFPSLAAGDLREEIMRCAALVAGRGMDFLVLNLTRPDIGFPAVRVAVPGLRSFAPRFAPGRLYDVPVQMGWLDGPLPEDRLNPVPMP